MEIKIGIQHVAREITVETESTAKDVEANLEKALADGSLLAVTDEKGRKVLVPADKIAYVEGSLVKTGQLLFQLDPKPFQAALANAKAVLAQQEALLTRARQTLARVKPLAKQNAVSQQDLDNSTAGVMTAEAQVQAAEAQVETAQLNLGYTTIKSPLNGLSSSANFREGALITPAGKNAQLTTIVQIDPI